VVTRSILVFGDSHVQALSQAARRREKFGKPIPAEIVRLARIKNGQRIGNLTFEEVLQRAATLSPDDLIVAGAGGSQHAVFSTIQHPQPFDFLRPASAGQVQQGRTLVPFRALEEAFAAPILKGVRKQLSAIRKASDARLLCLAPPPPKKSSDFIARNHDSRFASEGITKLGVTPAELRMKFYCWQDSLLRQVSDEFGATYLDPPPDSLEGSGFLHIDFSADDATHANARYGEAVLAQLEAIPLAREAAAA
jgi:hypothetical protein